MHINPRRLSYSIAARQCIRLKNPGAENRPGRQHVVALKSMANRNTLRAKIIAAFRRLFPPPPRGEPFRIAAFGDSLTAGFGLKTKEAFPPVLERRLRADGYNAVVFNAGVSGDTTQMGLARLEAMLASTPKLVILELGANDMLNDIDIDFTLANLEKMILRIRASGAQILLAGMRATEDKDTDFGRRFDAIYSALAAKYTLPCYPYFLEGVVGDPALVLWGGLHPTAKGVRVIVEGIAPVVERILDEVGARTI
jgi:acyl-CoA thioesterase I